MPKSATSEAATSSCVLSGFEPHRNTCAPPACSVRARFAVSVVTCRQAPMRRPLSGRSFAKRARIARSTGMWRSAHSMRALPSFASFMSFTWPAVSAGALLRPTWAPFAPGLLFLTSRVVLRTAMETPCVKAGESWERAPACPRASAPTSRFFSVVFQCYAYTYEADHAADRSVAARRVAPPRRGRRPHAHRGAGARAARGPRHTARGEARARGASLLRPGPVPRRPGAARAGAPARGGAVIAVDAGLLVLGV